MTTSVVAALWVVAFSVDLVTLAFGLTTVAGSGSQKMHDDPPTILHKSEIISITRDEGSEISSDLNSGRRPLSKSDEFSDPHL